MTDEDSTPLGRRLIANMEKLIRDQEEYLKNPTVVVDPPGHYGPEEFAVWYGRRYRRKHEESK